MVKVKNCCSSLQMYTFSGCLCYVVAENVHVGCVTL